MRRVPLVQLIAAAGVAGACATFSARGGSHPLVTPADRLNMIRRSQVWTPTDVASKDIVAGPEGSGGFTPGETVTCDYVEKAEHGLSPKFTCAIGVKEKTGQPDEVKVKYDVTNAEVYGEVASTRLLWALGFGADRMYPVRVVCRGCPARFHGAATLDSEPGARLFDPAAIERKAPGREIESKPYQGWAWKELDQVDPGAGGAPLAHRDALKLLAVFLQHGDSKAQQQRLVCLDKQAEDTPGMSEGAESASCAHPFMLISDLGLTFGSTDWLNRNSVGGANFARWSRTTVWKDPEGCVGKLGESLSGSLGNPVISESGRQFLSDLLMRLTDKQIHDLFTVSRITMRPPKTYGSAPGPGIDDWVAAFKAKRDEIAGRHCADPGPAGR